MAALIDSTTDSADNNANVAARIDDVLGSTTDSSDNTDYLASYFGHTSQSRDIEIGGGVTKETWGIVGE